MTSSPLQHADPSLQALMEKRPNLTLTEQGLSMSGVALSDIAAECGTPCWVIDATFLRKRYRLLKATMQATGLDIALHYAMKANSHLAVLSLLATEGAGMDIVSIGEFEKALHSGVPPAKMIFSGVGKTHQELTLAVSHAIGQINIESAEELEMLAEVCTHLQKKVPIALRVNPDVDAQTHAKITTGKAENKFGIAFDDALALYAKAQAHPYLEPLGFACHIGSQITNMAPFNVAFERLAGLVRAAREQNLTVKTLDCGGGVGISYRLEEEGSISSLAACLSQHFSGLDVKISLEPGRWLIGPCGVLLSTIIRKKKTSLTTFLIIDAAMNDLLRPSLYEAWHGILPLRTAAFSQPQEHVAVVGPVCESGDTFSSDRVLPHLQPDDQIAILDTGAYGAVMSSTYNARPLATQVMIENGQWSVITPRLPLSALWERETIPFTETET
ncbi:diaminopimelate decarboxylase [Entomobacter blattae]|uniref:Diaminopimelate decarboxylase n=1 Tax=Entomobacter blattae TaxID=2762277 RepID=A0A7H1NS06_9PROT|nr:diaminopimelate decarboxylase [Entomobacter blattae]QNT78566.1 Diaminopimelate decarboxylase [Entomobacter blattae]